MKHKLITFVAAIAATAGISFGVHAAETAAKPVEDIVTVSVVNFHPIWGENNIGRIKGFAKAAAKSGSDIIVFPEMALTGYDLDPKNTGDKRMQIRMAETVPGPSTDALKPVAAKYHAYIVFGLPEKKNGKIYNSVAVVTPDGKAFSYQKIHPFGTESTWCAKGDTPLLVDTEWGPVAIGICYDSYQFPELVRYYVAKGARLYINCTAQYEDPLENTGRRSFDSYYSTTLISHVVANEIFLASSNLVGLDNVTYFPGASMIIGPGIRKTTTPGDPVHHIYAGSIDDNQEGFVTATIDLALANRSLFKNNPVTGVPDFRPDLYEKLYKELMKPAAKK